MHPRLLAGRDCSGGSCPAVYDSDPDLLADELAIVGKIPSTGLAARLSDHIAPDEAVITISRGIVAEALRSADEPVTPDDFATYFETFAYTAFRLEAYQNPVGTARDDGWIAILKASRRWRKVHQRVRVVVEPLSAALRQELTEGYGPNVAAGEDIGIIPAGSEDEWPEDVPRSDFWLFDSSRLLVMHYEPDGTWAGASRVRDPERVTQACRARDAALHRSTSWRTYIADRPDLPIWLAQ